MNTNILFTCLLFVIIACSSTKTMPVEELEKTLMMGDSLYVSEPIINNVADDYGYSATNAIKVGDFKNGPSNERWYLERLTGPNGEPIAYMRLGSCCAFETKNSEWGAGMLDRYEIEIDGDPEKKILYINMYDHDTLYAPKGFLLDGK